ncbi:PAS domain-containing protein [Benzoatithermus flavus]|uniref:histidine kinase n=1 Tax=Benzoatithermus flavus TaxID=3108223 RepID=A0ABU8XP85_9PROT
MPALTPDSFTTAAFLAVADGSETIGITANAAFATLVRQKPGELTSPPELAQKLRDWITGQAPAAMCELVLAPGCSATVALHRLTDDEHGRARILGLVMGEPRPIAAEIPAGTEPPRARIGRITIWERDLGDGTGAEAQPIRSFELGVRPPGAAADQPGVFIHPEDRVLLNAAFARVRAGAPGCSVDVRLCCPDGSIRTLQIEGAVSRRDAAGRPIRLIGASIDVTELRATQARLEAREEQARQQVAELEALYERAPIGLVLLDRELSVLRLGRWLAARGLVSGDGQRGRKLGEAAPALVPIMEPHLQRVLTTGEPVDGVEVEIELPGTPGRKRHWLEQFYPLPAASAVGGIVQDVTERKEAEARLKESEARFRHLIATLVHAFVLEELAPERRLLYVSPGYERLWGRPMAELERDPGAWLAAVRPADRPEVEAALAALAAAREPVHRQIEYRIVRPDGTERWIRDLMLSLREPDDHGHRLARLAQDVTELKEAEAALHRAQAEVVRLLTDLQASLSFVDQFLPGVLFRMSYGPDGEPRYSRVSAAVEHYYGVEPEAVIRDGRLLLERVHPEDRPGLPVAASEPGPRRALYRARGADGRWRWMQATVMPRWLESGELVWDGIAIDVTALKEAEEASKAAALAAERARAAEALSKRLAEEGRARAEAADRAKSAFLAMMSHEIRTPLTAVLGFADLLAKAPLADEHRNHVRIIQDTGRALLTILNDILDFSKLEAGKLELELRPLELGALLTDVMAATRLLAGEKGLDFRLEIAPELPASVLADSVRLRQLLSNLLSNAVKFTEHGSVTLRARVLGTDGHVLTVRIEVEDTGIGIGEAEQQRLFNAFEQADQSISRRFGGTGLGLAIARRLTELMGGRIGVTSTPGIGSTFWVELPFSLSAASPRAETAIADQPQAMVQPARVLVVDDVATNRQLIAALLKALGHVVTLAVDGEEAIAKAEAEDFDLILMDVNMPKLDGLSAARAIRAGQGRNARTPIVALTANTFPEEIAACRAAGMNGHLAKPIDRRSLSAMLADQLPARVDRMVRTGPSTP